MASRPDSSAAWGGPWTEQKLGALIKYLSAYTKILRGKGLEYWYVDAFAGAGYRQVPTKKTGPGGGLFESVADEPAMREFQAGSSIHALRADPPFMRYCFCDSNSTSLAILQKRIERDYPQHEFKVTYSFGDANETLELMCTKWRSNRRAVMFVDPYGMQVSWDTLRAIAGTRGVDLWILFPVGAVNRMLTLKADIPVAWQDQLTRQFGTKNWGTEFYKAKPQMALPLVGDDTALTKVADADSIVAFYLDRLRTIFPYVAPNTLKLKNSRASVLYALCFAAANPRERAGGLGAKIANDILLKE